MLVNEGLLVLIRSTLPVKVLIPFACLPHLCPVKAWIAFKTEVNPWPLGPAFVNPSGLPLTPRRVVQIIRLALKYAGVPAYDKFSMHSIRRGAAQAAAKGGVSEQELKLHGIWRSDKGLHSYVPKYSGIVPHVLHSALAN